MLGSYEHVLFNLALLTLHRKKASVKTLLYAKRTRLTYTAFKMHLRVSLYIFDKQIANSQYMYLIKTGRCFMCLAFHFTFVFLVCFLKK